MTSDKVSSGILIHNGCDELLLVFPGGPKFENKGEVGLWGIPKGECCRQSENYTYEMVFQSALREVEEETGITLPNDESLYTFLGTVKQLSGKLVYAWGIHFPVPENFKFSSTLFTMEWPPNSGQAGKFPEISQWKFFKFDEAKTVINPRQSEFISRLELKLGEQT